MARRIEVALGDNESSWIELSSQTEKAVMGYAFDNNVTAQEALNEVIGDLKLVDDTEDETGEETEDETENEDN